MSTNQFYKKWAAMKTRCKDNQPFSYLYKERGIKVCKRWEKFQNFKKDMYESYIKTEGKLSLDRINNNKGYSKKNCRWATSTQQARNRTSNKYISAFGKTMCINAWADEIKIPKATLWARLNKCKWSITKSLTEPLRSY